jgi:Holliday junction DNA helicase RuvB
MSSAISTLTLEAELCEGLAADEALRRAQSALRMGQVGHRIAAFFLADLADRKAFRELGSPSLKHLARTRLRIAESTARHLVTLGRGLRSLPVIDADFAADRLTLSQVLPLLPIATPETDGAWAAWAADKTVPEIKRQAARREKGDLPTSPERRRIHEPRQRAGADLVPTDFEVWRRARQKLEAMLGRPVSDRDMMMELAQWILCVRPDGTIPGWTRVNDRHYQLHAWPRGHDDDELVTIGEDGEEVAIDPAQLTARLNWLASSGSRSSGSTEEVELAVLDPENHGRLVPMAKRDVPTGDDLREEVLKRDGYQCRSCGSRDNVTVHHRVWRSYGGKTVASNLLATCEACHSLIHGRLLIVLGDPEGELRFLDRKGRPSVRVPAQPLTFVVSNGGAAPPAALAWTAGPRLDFDGLPSEVDAGWWERHRHLLTWSERQGELDFTAGYAREVAAPTLTEKGAAPSEEPRANGLAALVGQTAVRERLDVALTAARHRDEPLGHLLFAGAPGLGKTTLARAVATELEAHLVELPAPQVRTVDALMRTLTSLRGDSVLFMDELHALPARAAETLYAALDEGVLSLPVREGLRTRPLRVHLRPFTLIGATTDPDQLPRPLLSRLRVQQLEPYTTDELTALLERAARERGLGLTPEGAERLALASRDTPRRALALLDAVRDEASAAGVATADLPLVERALAREQVDGLGLGVVERRYVSLLSEARGPVGLGALAAQLDVSEQALRTIHEPLLLRRGVVQITAAGRVLARAG